MPENYTFHLTVEDLRANWAKYANYLSFEREDVWPGNREKFCIEGILRGYPIPEFHLAKIGEKFGFIQGKQRLSTLRKYLEDGFTTFKAKQNPPYGSVDPNKTYSELSAEYQAKINKAVLTMQVIENMEEWELADFYRWTQYQRSLILPEKIWTYPSETKKHGIQLLEHKFWHQNYGGNQSRKRPFLGCYYLMLLEVTHSDINMNERRLREFGAGIDDDSINSSMIENIQKRLDTVYHVFRGTVIKDVREVIPVYEAVRILEDAQFDLQNSEKGCLTSWYKAVQDKAVIQRQKYRVTDTLFKMTHVKYRQVFWDEQEPKIIQQPGLRWRGKKQSFPVDPQAVVEKQGGRCPVCDKTIDNVLGGDYVMQYKKDAPITVENCAVVHRACNEHVMKSMHDGDIEVIDLKNASSI